MIVQTSRREARKEARRESIIATARASFLEKGYAATSMSSIAAVLGGSKSTLWAYYSSKEKLFAAVLDAEIGRFLADLLALLDVDNDIDATLRRFGRVLLARVLSQDALHLQRIIASEAERFPEMGRLFYERAPARIEQRLTAYLQHAVAEERLRDCDPQVAAKQLISLCQSGRYMRCLGNVEEVPRQAVIDDDADAAVDTFMRAFGPNDFG